MFQNGLIALLVFAASISAAPLSFGSATSDVVNQLHVEDLAFFEKVVTPVVPFTLNKLWEAVFPKTGDYPYPEVLWTPQEKALIDKYREEMEEKALVGFWGAPSQHVIWPIEVKQYQKADGTWDSYDEGQLVFFMPYFESAGSFEKRGDRQGFIYNFGSQVKNRKFAMFLFGNLGTRSDWTYRFNGLVVQMLWDAAAGNHCRIPIGPDILKRWTRTTNFGEVESLPKYRDALLWTAASAVRDCFFSLPPRGYTVEVGLDAPFLYREGIYTDPTGSQYVVRFPMYRQTYRLIPRTADPGLLPLQATLLYWIDPVRDDVVVTGWIDDDMSSWTYTAGDLQSWLRHIMDMMIYQNYWQLPDVVEILERIPPYPTEFPANGKDTQN